MAECRTCQYMVFIFSHLCTVLCTALSGYLVYTAIEVPKYPPSCSHYVIQARATLRRA